jgi:ABC-2 type transport system permease protein
MIHAHKVLMLIRREIWENRSLWIAPLVISGVILIAAAFSGINVDTSGGFPFGRDPDGSSVARHIGGSKIQVAYAVGISAIAMTQLVALGVLVFFYLLDALLAERKDRSILFWKSLPVSDTEVVASKALTGLVVTPAYVLLLSAVTQLVVGLVVWLRFGSSPLGSMIIPVDFGVWAQVQVAFWAFAPAVILWYLPLAAYLLLVSVWARRNAFLWAVLPPVAILLIEGLLLQSHRFASFLLYRFSGVFKLLDLDSLREGGGVSPLAEFLRHVAGVFTNYQTWVGVLVAIAFLVAVIRIRRYRDDS